MSVEILLPKIGFSMTDGEVSEWLVPDGSVVTEGEALYTLTSEKATQEVEAPGSGILKILIKAGEEHPVGTVLGTID